MEISKARRAILLAGAFSMILPAAFAQSQAPFPDRPVTLIVGFPPGGPTDVIARLIADKLSAMWKQSVIVENKPGASANIAARTVASAKPDGYTLLYTTSALAISPGLYDKLPFNVVEDFAPITETVTIPLVLAVHPSVPVKNLAEFIAYLRDNPGKLNYASAGLGTPTFLGAALFLQEHGLKAQHVAYKGTAPALTDLAAGTVQFTFGLINTALPFIRDGRLNAIAVTSLARSAALPDIPTLEESGMKGFEASAWHGMYAPAKTPDGIIRKINEDVAKVLKMDDIAAHLGRHAAQVRATSSDAFAQYTHNEVKRWTKVAQDNNAKAE